MRTQTETKIKNIKNAIEKKEDLKSIEKRFFNTVTKKKEFLDRVYSYFSNEDLEYLEYVNEAEKLTAEMKDKKEKEKKNITDITDSNIQENNDITNITNSNTDETNNITNNINNESITDITKKYTEFFKDIGNVNALFEMVQKYRNSQEHNIEVLESGELSIPLEARSIKADTNISLKTNAEQYEILKQIAYKNRIGIGQLINFVFWEFIKKHS